MWSEPFLSQNKVSLTKILQEASLKTLIEMECIDEELKINNFNEDESFEMIEATISGRNSLFNANARLLHDYLFFFSYGSRFEIRAISDRSGFHSLQSKFNQLLICEISVINSASDRLTIRSRNLARWRYSRRSGIGRCRERFAWKRPAPRRASIPTLWSIVRFDRVTSAVAAATAVWARIAAMPAVVICR